MDERITVDELLDVAEEFGFSPEERKQWWKIGELGEVRVYVKKAGQRGFASEVHFSGFAVDDPLVLRLSPEEAVAQHLGNVRGKIVPATFKSARRDQILRVFRLGLDTLVESAVVREPRPALVAPRSQGAPVPTQPVSVDPVEIEDALLAFEGYGTSDASLLLLGIEEGFGGRLSNPGWSVQRELDARARWDSITDARDACADLEDRYWERRNYSRVWRNAAKLARAIIEDADDWLDTDVAHDYVIRSLGRSTGETLLGELFPLPAVGLHHWPYRSRWADREEYRRALWPTRRRLWRDRLAQSKARLVICYGTDVRPYACDLFGCRVRPGIYTHDDGTRRVVFAPFIGGRTSNDVLREIVDAALG